MSAAYLGVSWVPETLKICFAIGATIDNQFGSTNACRNWSNVFLQSIAIGIVTQYYSYHNENGLLLDGYIY